MNAATPCCKTPESLRAFTLMKWLVLLGALVLLLLCWQLGWCEGEWHPSGAPRLASVAAPVVAPVLAPIAPPPAPAVLQSALVSAQWQDGKVKLVGTVASADDKAKAFEAAKQAFGAEKVADELQVKDGYKGIEWIELSGEAATQTERAAAEASVREAFVGLAGAQLRVDNRMTI